MSTKLASAAFKKKKKSKFIFDKSKNIDVSIFEQRAYEFLVRQQEAKEWIQDMINDKLPPGTANFSDNLRDGVVLCQLANAFAPGSVTKIHKPKIGSVLEFMATDNIAQFFRACEKASFPKIYFFEVPDLWEKKNVMKVVHCIHTLAHFLNEKGVGAKIKNLSSAGLTFDEDEIQKTKDELKKLEDSEQMVSFIGDSQHIEEDEESEDQLDELADPDQCVMEGVGMDEAVAGQKASFEIIARDVNGSDIKEGGESFNVVLFYNQDPSVKVVATVTDLENGRYRVEYLPERSGSYSMEVHLVDMPDEADEEEEDGESGDLEPETLLIKGCPKTVVVKGNPVSEPTKCEIEGKGSQSAVAGVASSFTLKSRDKYGNLGQGGEEFVAQLISGDTVVDAEVTDNQDGTYTFTYLCPKSGTYQLQVKKKGSDELVGGMAKTIIVKDAGISDPTKCVLDVEDLASITQLKAGAKVEFSIQAKDNFGNNRSSGGESFAVKLIPVTEEGQEDANRNVVDATVNDSNDGKYHVSYQPQQAGKFQLKIFLGETLIAGTPLDCTIQDTGVTAPQACTVKLVTSSVDTTGDDVNDFRRLRAGQSRTVVVEARDQFGNLRPTGGERFLMNIVSKKSLEAISHDKIQVKDCNNGTYEMSFSLTDAGDYALEILHQQKEEDEEAKNINGFPCNVVCLDSGQSDPQMTDFEGEGLRRAVSNQQTKFIVKTRDQYGNKRAQGGDQVKVVLVNNKRKLQFNAEVTDLEDGNYEVTYTPTTSGDYSVQIMVNGEQVDNDALRQSGIGATLYVEPPAAKMLTENELSNILDHDLLSSLVNSFHVEADNENLVDQIQEIRDKLIKQIRENNQVEQDVKDLERKIQLLIANRVKIEEVIIERENRGVFKRKKTKITAAPGEAAREGNDEKMIANYSKLFYLLQTEAKYLSQTLYLVPPENVEKFLETVILTLYGYAFSPREEYLILSLFRQTLQLEISKAKKVGSFLNNNPVLPKMVLTYGRRNQGRTFLQKILFDKIVTNILNEKELNLELNAVKILKDHISKEEVRTGVKSKVNLKDLTYQKAMEDEVVSKIVLERVEKLTQICQFVLDGIIDHVDDIPYGLRWISKQLDQLLKQKHPDSSEAERASVIGYIVYYRFMNPAIVSPETFELTTKKITMNMRNNLVIISKVLTNLTNNVLFDAKIEEQMTVMNEWLKKSQQVYIEKFIRNLVKVDEPEETLGVHQYLELTQKKSPTITITWSEIFNTHDLLLKYIAKIAPEKEDPLRKLLLEDMTGQAPPNEANFKGDLMEEVTLPLVNKFIEGNIEKAKQLTPEQIYEQTKDAFRFVLKAIPSDNLGENVLDTLKVALDHAQLMSKDEKTATAANLVISKIRFINENLPKLADAEIVSKSNNYRKMLIDITKEIQNQKTIREKQRKELTRLKESLDSLTDHFNFLKERSTEFEEYIEDCRLKHFQQGYGAKVKRKKVKKAEGEKFKFSYKQLKEKGVIKELNVMKSQRSKIKFAISMTGPGVFDVEARLAGMTVKTITLELDDLLDKQAKGVQDVKFDNVILDINMTLYILQKLFTK